MHPRVVPEDGPEAYLLNKATGCAVSGHRLAELGDVVDPVVAHSPWLDFVDGFIGHVQDQAERKPGCLADLYLQRGLAKRIRNAPIDR